jgi:hypothetical protein
MKPNCKLTTVLLVILGVLDLVAIPFMIAANHHTKGTPPAPAIVVVGVVAVATLISAAGVARGLRWAFWVAMTCRIIDALSNFLGLTNHPTRRHRAACLGEPAPGGAAGARGASDVSTLGRIEVVIGAAAGPADETPPGACLDGRPECCLRSAGPRRCRRRSGGDRGSSGGRRRAATGCLAR